MFYIGVGEDYESGTTSYELTVRASDGTNATDTIVTVNVTDLQEQTIVVPADPENLQNVSEPYGEDLPTNTSTIGRVAVGGAATGNIGRRATGMGLRWSWLRGGPTSSISGAARRATAR